MPVLRSADPICGGCFLYERRGVCPAARDAYGLENSAEAERRTEQFRQAVAAEAERQFTLADLLQIETERQLLGAPLSSAALPIRALAAPDRHAESRKEAVYVHAARASR